MLDGVIVRVLAQIDAHRFESEAKAEWTFSESNEVSFEVSKIIVFHSAILLKYECDFHFLS